MRLRHGAVRRVHRAPERRRLHRLEENLGAANVTLTADDLRTIEESAAKIPVQDARLPEAVLKLTNR